MRRTLGFATLILILALAAAVTGADAAHRHTRLVKSAPAKDSTVTAPPAALELWFNEKVELAATRVRLTHAGGAVITLGKLTRDDTRDDPPVTVPVESPMTDGVYTVAWATASKDGHPVNGTFAFTLRRAP